MTLNTVIGPNFPGISRDFVDFGGNNG